MTAHVERMTATPSTAAAERVGRELRPALNEVLAALTAAQDPVLAARTVHRLGSTHLAIALSCSVFEGHVAEDAALEALPKRGRKAFRKLLKARRHAAECGHAVSFDLDVPGGVWTVRVGEPALAKPTEMDHTVVILTSGMVVELDGARYRDPATLDGWMPGWSGWSLNRCEVLTVDGRHWDTDRKWTWEPGIIAATHTARELESDGSMRDAGGLLLLVVEDAQGERHNLTLDEQTGEIHWLATGVRQRARATRVFTPVGGEVRVIVDDRARSLGTLVRALVLDPVPLHVGEFD